MLDRVEAVFVRALAGLLTATLLFLAGCSGSSPSLEADDGHDHENGEGADHGMEPKMSMHEGNLVVSAATELRTVNAGGAYTYPLDVKANVTGFVLELVWSPGTAGPAQLDLWIRPAGNGVDAAEIAAPPANVAQATGPTPLRLELPRDVFPGEGLYEALVRAAPEAPLALQQPFTLHVLTFDGIPFEPDHEAHEHQA